MNNNKEIDNKNNELIDNNKALVEISKENDISFISLVDGKEKNNKVCKIKNMNILKKMNETEKNLLKGFIQEEPKEEKYITKISKHKLKTDGQHFLENLELLQKTNLLAFKNEEKKEERYLKQLEKKMMALKIIIEKSLEAFK